jgi:hypothetical protein
MFAQPGTCTQSEKYAGCPFGQIKDWAGICFKESEAKACPTCAPGSAAAAEKSSTSPPKIEAIKIPPPAESTSPTKIQAEKPSTSPPRTCGLGPCLDFEKMKAAPRPKCNSSALKPTWIPSKSEWVCLPRVGPMGRG